jgi:D-proline reductase (dithiol) PrdB
MASLSELSLRDRLWFRTYRFRRAAAGPAAVLPTDVAAARIALVTSAGLHLATDRPFAQVKGGDWSWRVIPAQANANSLACSHPSGSWDRTGVNSDANVAFPTARLGELASHGAIGSAAPRHASIQGSILAPGRLVRDTAPAIADMFLEDHVDGVVLAPV